MDDEKIHKIAKENGVSPARVLIAWHVQRGTVVLPKSVTAERIIDNFKGKVDILFPYKRYNIS